MAWTTRENSLKVAALTGLMMGLAVLAKEISALFVIGFVGAVFARYVGKYRGGELARADLHAALVLVVCGIAPFAAFESWRFATLGGAGFIANWQEHFALVGRDSAAPSSFAQLFERILERMRVVDDRYRIALPLAAALGVLSFVVTRIGASRRTILAARMIAYGLVLHTLYWLIFSNGWVRYLYIAVVIWCFFVTLPLLEGLLWRDRGASWLATSLVIAFGIAYVERFYLLHREFRDIFQGTNIAERRVIGYLDRQQHGAQDQVYSTSWAHIAALEYFSTRPARFQRGALAVVNEPGKPVHVVINAQLAGFFRETDWVAALARCGPPVLRSGPYRLFYCDRG